MEKMNADARRVRKELIVSSHLNRDIPKETGSLKLRFCKSKVSRPAQFSASRKPLLAQSTELCDVGIERNILYLFYKGLGTQIFLKYTYRILITSKFFGATVSILNCLWIELAKSKHRELSP